MFFYKNVSISKEIKLKIVPTPPPLAAATTTTTTLTVPWSGLRRRLKKTRLCDLGGVLPPCQKVGAQNVGKILQLARGKCILHLHMCGCSERRVENPGAWGEMFVLVCPHSHDEAD